MLDLPKCDWCRRPQWPGSAAKNWGRSRMKRHGVLTLGVLILAALAASTAAPALAQERYPARPIRLVIPSVPAGVHDVIGRASAERVKPQLGAIVGDNRGGGGGLSGANHGALSPADGPNTRL